MSQSCADPEKETPGRRTKKLRTRKSKEEREKGLILER